MRPESHSGPDSIKVTKVIFSLAKKNEDGRPGRRPRGTIDRGEQTWACPPGGPRRPENRPPCDGGEDRVSWLVTLSATERFEIAKR